MLVTQTLEIPIQPRNFLDLHRGASGGYLPRCQYGSMEKPKYILNRSKSHKMLTLQIKAYYLHTAKFSLDFSFQDYLRGMCYMLQKAPVRTNLLLSRSCSAFGEMVGLKDSRRGSPLLIYCVFYNSVEGIFFSQLKQVLCSKIVDSAEIQIHQYSSPAARAQP